MTDAEQKSPKGPRIDEKQRYRYIGFEVFPGKPGDLFKNQAEQEKLVEKVVAKRTKGGLDLEGCTLIEERVSFGEKLVMAVASVAMLLALLLPWYTVYSEVPAEAAEQPAAAAVVDDSLAVLGAQDSLAVLVEHDTLVIEELVSEEAAPGADVAEEMLAEAEQPGEVAGIRRHVGERSNEEILTGHAIRRTVNKEYSHLSGFGAFAALGSVGSAIFSSGFILIISAVLMLAYGLLCIGLPVLNFYSLFGLKGSADDAALKMKKYLRYNWLPVVLLLVIILLSFVGAGYDSDVVGSFTSLGDGYNVGVLLGTLSWGVFVSMAASILVAVKGIEI